MDLQTFFAAEPVLMAQGNGFAPFGAGHLGALALSITGIAVLTWCYCHLPSGLKLGTPRRKLLLTIAGAFVLMRLSHDVACIAAGSFTPRASYRAFWAFSSRARI